MYTVGHSRVVSTGIYLPEERVSSRELLQEIDSKGRFGIPFDWLERVTGVKEKRMTSRDVMPSDMAVSSAKEAMERAKISAHQIDAIIYTGLSKDYLEPATAHIVQDKLKATNSTVFDMSNACHGFMNGMHVMDALIATGQVRYGLVVTGEQGSALTRRAIKTLENATERAQFMSVAAALTVGDAGAAIVMGPKQAPDSGLVGLMLQSQGQHANLCTVSDNGADEYMYANMPSIVEETAKLMAEMFRDLMYGRLKWQIQELTKYVIHQVGNRTFQIYSKLTGVPTAIMPKTIDVLGNLITANIPVSLHYCAINREIKSGNKIYFSGTGSGISLSQAGLIWDAT